MNDSSTFLAILQVYFEAFAENDAALRKELLKRCLVLATGLFTFEKIVRCSKAIGTCRWLCGSAWRNSD